MRILKDDSYKNRLVLGRFIMIYRCIKIITNKRINRNILLQSLKIVLN